jgi:hypothetical protein
MLSKPTHRRPGLKLLAPPLCGLLISLAVLFPAAGSETTTPPQAEPAFLGRHLADYNSELRRPDGRVDTDALLTRLKELHVTAYYWLIWHAATDWDDLKLFLPKAREADIAVWVYLVPPSESPPIYGRSYSEPFRLDYQRWAEEIARLSLEHPNLTAWVIDDFGANRRFFTPDYVRRMQQRAKQVNSKLAFLPLLYSDDLRSTFVTDYRETVDGVVVAYLQDRDEIDWAWAVLNDAAVPVPGELSYPWNVPSKAGDYVAAGQAAEVLTAGKHLIRFRDRDDFTADTAGYHFKQLLVDDEVVWEQDVAGGTPQWQPIQVDISPQVQDKKRVRLTFRLIDKRGVSNFGVRWRVGELQTEGLRLGAGLDESRAWQVTRQGAFETGFVADPKSGQRRFRIPFISMTAGTLSDYQKRHGEPATPQAVADLLRVSLQAWRDGKCDGVVTYCLDKRPGSKVFEAVKEAFHEFREDKAGP